MTFDEILHQAHDLLHEMKTCGYNSYGVKRNTYYNWVRRMENIVGALDEQEGAPLPPPPPTPKTEYSGTD